MGASAPTVPISLAPLVMYLCGNIIKDMGMINGAKLMGAVGALAPTVFLPRPEIIQISVPLFLPRPEVVLILTPTLFSPVRRQCICNCNSICLYLHTFSNFYDSIVSNSLELIGRRNHSCRNPLRQNPLRQNLLCSWVAKNAVREFR